MDLEQAKIAVHQLAELPPRAEQQRVRELACEALEMVSRGCSEAQLEASEAAGGEDPFAQSLADTLGALADELAVQLAQRGLLELEQKARAIHCVTVLALQSDLHHRVGPAMLAHGDCHQRLGDHDQARQIYNAVIADFTWLLDDGQQQPMAPDPDRATALQCLRTAIERELPYRSGTDAAPLQELLARCESLE